MLQPCAPRPWTAIIVLTMLLGMFSTIEVAFWFLFVIISINFLYEVGNNFYMWFKSTGGDDKNLPNK